MIKSRAAVAFGPGQPLQIVEVDVAPPQAGEVLVRIVASGVCHTDAFTLSGDDPDKADAMLEAFKKGFEQATKAWGDKLPDISQRTYDAVVEKFNKWKNGTEDASTEA